MSPVHRERFWNQLLDLISKGNVVPVVGEELLRLPGEPEGVTFYRDLAKRYAAYCGFEVEDEKNMENLSAAVCRHRDFQRNPYNVYDDVRETVKEWNPAIPESLRTLARIRHFNLFVSTTFDDLLERALNEERFGGKEKTEVIAYSPKNVPRDERIASQIATGRPVIFQCFGTYKKSIDFALTQGDMVEYVHALQTLNHQPKGIFSELYDRSLLLLGNSFPDWLMRIFLRMARNSSLDYRDVPKQIVVDGQTQNEPLLRFYLRNFTTNTELIEEPGPVEFIEELYRRWSERFGTEETLEPTVSTTTESAMSPYAVFISYCRTDYFGESTRDQKVAFAIREELEKRGVEVWLDQRALEGGDDYSKKIRRYINTCSIFMPLISEITESRVNGFFRQEWGWALERLPRFTGSDLKFLFPVLIDDIDFKQAKIPDEFKGLQYTRLMTEKPEVDFLDLVQRLYQKARPPRR
jgi:hypothetical protein